MMRNNRSRPNLHVAVGTAAVAVTVGLSCILARKLHHSLVVQYGGIVGALRMIWEGDHLPSHIRISLDTLEDIKDKHIAKENRRLEKIEIIIQAAKLNSVDHEYEHIITNNENRSPTNNTVFPKYYILTQEPSLKKDLSRLSQNLDKIAAKIDEVPSFDDVTVRCEKKILSKRVVEMMEVTDRYISECGYSTGMK